MTSHKEPDRFHARKNPRLQNYDYSTPNYYFVTICTEEKQCIFGRPNQLNGLGNIARDKLLETEAHFPNVSVDKWVVMPNHIHAIIVLHQHNVQLPVIIGLYKSSVTKQIHTTDPDVKVWQSSFHDHIIRNQRDYERIWTYIDANPTRWEDDCFYKNLN